MAVLDVDKTVIVVHRLERAAGNSQTPNEAAPVRPATNGLLSSRGNAITEGVDWPNLDRKSDGSCYLIDMCPPITDTTSRRELLPGVPWQLMEQMDQVEWRCWKLIQAWRRLAHGARRHKFKKGLWHHLRCHADVETSCRWTP